MTNEIEIVEKETMDLTAKAMKVNIVSPDHYTTAAVFLKTIKSMQKRASECFDPIVKKTNEAWKEACSQRKKVIEPLEKVEVIIKNKMLDFNTEQARISAIKQAEERDRIEKEAKELEERARKAEEKGKTEKAQELRMQAATIPENIIESKVPKTEGISTKENWEFKIVNESLIPREYLKIDEVSIKKDVNIFKKANAIPGIEAFRKDIISARGA